MCDADDMEILCDICAGIVSCCCCYWFYAIRFEQPPKKTAVIGSEKSQSLDYVPNPTVASMVHKVQIDTNRRPSLGQKIMAAVRKKSSMALRTPRGEISGNGFMIPQSRLNLVSERSLGDSPKKMSLVPNIQMEAVKRQSWNKNIMDTARKNSSLLPHLNISEKKIMNLQRVITFQEPTSYSPINKNPFKKSKKNKLQITNEINRKFSYKNANPDINYYNERNSNNSNNGENNANSPLRSDKSVVASIGSENRRFSSAYDRNKVDKSDMNNSGNFII